MLSVVSLYLDGTDGSLGSVDVGGVVQRFHLLEHRFKFVERLRGKLSAQRIVLRHFGQAQSVEHRLNVKPRAAAHNRQPVAAANRLLGSGEIADVFKQVVFISCRTNINKVVRHIAVFVEVFSRADVHAAINLAAVG